MTLVFEAKWNKAELEIVRSDLELVRYITDMEGRLFGLTMMFYHDIL